MGKYDEGDTEVINAIWKLQVKIAKAECGLGIDTTKAEWTRCKAKQQGYMMKIKELDVDFYDKLEVDRNETEEDKKLKERFK